MNITQKSQDILETEIQNTLTRLSIFARTNVPELTGQIYMLGKHFTEYCINNRILHKSPDKEFTA